MLDFFSVDFIQYFVNVIIEMEYVLILYGLYVVGCGMDEMQCVEIFMYIVVGLLDVDQVDDLVLICQWIVVGDQEFVEIWLKDEDNGVVEFVCYLGIVNDNFKINWEFYGLVQVLDVCFVLFVLFGDFLCILDFLFIGCNFYGFDFFGILSKFVFEDGVCQVVCIFEWYFQSDGILLEMIVVVLWGMDNLKIGGVLLVQVMVLMGVWLCLDVYNWVCGVELILLEEFNCLWIDVVMIFFGIFWDLLLIQVSMLVEVSYLVVIVDELVEQNFICKYVLVYCEVNGCDLEVVVYWVFFNVDGVYGFNVNMLIGLFVWMDDEEIVDIYIS